MWSTDDATLQLAGDEPESQIDECLETWDGFADDRDFLQYVVAVDTNEPINDSLERSRERFGQWIRDSCDTVYDKTCLDYQFEIGHRHYRKTSPTTSATPHTRSRCVNAFIDSITATTREFLENNEFSRAAIGEMYHAWFNSVGLQATLWSHPYIVEGWWPSSRVLTTCDRCLVNPLTRAMVTIRQATTIHAVAVGPIIRAL